MSRAEITTCLFCGVRVEDGRHLSGATGPDWHHDGDFGCDESPWTLLSAEFPEFEDETGSGDHVVTEDAAEKERAGAARERERLLQRRFKEQGELLKSDATAATYARAIAALPELLAAATALAELMADLLQAREDPLARACYEALERIGQALTAAGRELPWSVTESLRQPSPALRKVYGEKE